MFFQKEIDRSLRLFGPVQEQIKLRPQTEQHCIVGDNRKASVTFFDRFPKRPMEGRQVRGEDIGKRIPGENLSGLS